MSNYGRAGFALALLLGGLILAGCGKKAAHLDTPSDVEVDHYPMVYPDPATDPKPEIPSATPKAE